MNPAAAAALLPSSPPRATGYLLGLLVAFVAFFGATNIAAAACANAAAEPAATSEGAVESTTLCLLNDERRQAGRRPLRLNETLSTAAERHARDMAEKGYFDHDSPDGRSFLDRIKAAGYLSGRISSWTVGENIAWGSGSLGTPASIVEAWMESPGHRRNILSADFREIGFGLAAGGDAGSLPARSIYATEFGTRR
jgi:uncharacterized protein YkwD